MFWTIIHYGWFVFMALSVFSVFGAAIWDSTAPKRRLKQLERDRLRREQEAAKAAEAEAAAAAAASEAAVEPASVETPSAEPVGEEAAQASEAVVVEPPTEPTS